MENSKDIFVIKKDGTKEKFELDKVINAIKKSAQRVLIEFTPAQVEEICTLVQKEVEDCGRNEVYIQNHCNQFIAFLLLCLFGRYKRVGRFSSSTRRNARS